VGRVGVTRETLGQTRTPADLTAPFTPGAFEGGSRACVHGERTVGQFTYESEPRLGHRPQTRRLGIQTNQRQRRPFSSNPPDPVPRSPKSHHATTEGDFFSVLVTQTTDHSHTGFHEISVRAYSDACGCGSNGYPRDGAPRQTRAPRSSVKHPRRNVADTVPRIIPR